MTNEQKSVMYGQLLNEHTRLHNRINEIKGSNIDLSQSNLNEIKSLENQQFKIIETINNLLRI